MSIFKRKKVTIKELQDMNIANDYGVIDYQKFSDYKKIELKKGYNVYLDIKDGKQSDLIDNESVIYNGKEFKANNDLID